MAEFKGFHPEIMNAVRALQGMCHNQSYTTGWWKDAFGDELIPDEAFPTKLALIHSELSEALEAHRKDDNDDKVPWRKGAEVELADALFRIFDLAHAMDYDLIAALSDKFAYNATRADHKPEARFAPGGKRY